MVHDMQEIVVGIDGSDASKQALRWAVEEARAHGARVTAVHAWESPPPVPDVAPMPAIDFVNVIPELRTAAEKLVTDVVEEVVGDDTSVTVELAAVEASPANALIDAAREADLVVVGSRGLGGFKALVLGSVSHQVAQHAPCPVVIHRARVNSVR
jgi:nucleotide-binding universal stress UspA family protein